MIINNSSHHERGSILVISLVILGLLALTLIAVLNMVSTQRTVVSRAQSWNAAIPMCEAGIEDAMAHLNYNYMGATNLASDGWTLTTTNYFRTNAMSGGYYSVGISTSAPPVITSQGFVFDPLKSNYLTRTVRVNTRLNGLFPKAIVAKGQITLGGNATVDSFNSTNSAYNNGFGAYASSKAEANAELDSLGNTPGIINVGSKIYGKVDTAPGGTAITVGGAVGDAAWVASNTGIESGHSAADVNTVVPDVVLPMLAGALTPTSGASGLTNNYTYVLRGGTYVLSSLSLASSQSICVSAPSVLYVSNSLALAGQAFIYVAPGASLQLYVGGPTCSLAGGGVVNSASSAANFALWGLPTLTTVTVTGGSGFIGTVYAPEADCTYTGNSDTSGAVVAKSFTMSGTMNFHYDEALDGPVGYKYLVSSWQEQ